MKQGIEMQRVLSRRHVQAGACFHVRADLLDEFRRGGIGLAMPVDIE